MDTEVAPPSDQFKYKEIVLTRGFVAFVDPEDFDWLRKFRWNFCGYPSVKGRARGYAYRSERGEKIFMHREVMGILPGDPRIVGHKNGYRLDNRKSNLIVVNIHGELQNLHNLPGWPPYPVIPSPSYDASERSFLKSRVKDESLLWRWRALMKLKLAILSQNKP